MNRLWLWLAGNYHIRLTGPEPERSIRNLSRQIRLEQVVPDSELCVTFLISRMDLSRLKKALSRTGDRIEILEAKGLPEHLRVWKQYPVFACVAVMLLAMTILLPERILFLKVEGNERVPDALILERAADCGLSFWTDREDLRSEQIKNRLLSALPELSWVGVNTSGSCAVISVRERQQEQETEPELPGNIVAVTDALVTDITAASGQAMCAPGDAVKEGQVLISGYTDLGLCTHVEQARGEVYGMTQRQNTAVIPVKSWIRMSEGTSIKKYSLIFGKKRINFYSDSGILYIGCGKMTQIRYLCLPGGWRLPVALVTECYEPAQWTETGRWETSGRDILLEQSLVQLKAKMRAGEILTMECAYDRTDLVQTLKLRP